PRHRGRADEIAPGAAACSRLSRIMSGATPPRIPVINVFHRGAVAGVLLAIVIVVLVADGC
ncbi:MAG: hypothetical protein ACREN5_06835, partial [Gemmatimonadales bacterium]